MQVLHHSVEIEMTFDKLHLQMLLNNKENISCELGI